MASRRVSAFILILALMLGTGAFVYQAEAQKDAVGRVVETDVGVEESDAVVVEKVLKGKGASEIYVVPIVVESGNRGIKRLLIGTVLLAAAIIHCYKVTYPRVATRMARVKKAAEKVLSPHLGGQTSYHWIETYARNYFKYAENNRVRATGEVVVGLAGLFLLISGVAALSVPSRVPTIRAH